MKESNKSMTKNIVPKEEDFNISITNEHNEQELTSMGETGKSSGIINATNFHQYNITFINKNKLYNTQFEQYQTADNFSMYTNIKKERNKNRNINDEAMILVRKKFFN